MAFQNYVGGQWVASDETLQNTNPSDTSDVIGDFCVADQSCVEAAVDAATTAGRQWAKETPQVRSDALRKIGDAILARHEELGRVLAREEGKTLGEAKMEALRAGQIFHFFSGEALRLGGETLDSVRPGVEVDVLREAIGVVAIITPWNFPLAIPAWKIAPALAFGNSVVFKPSEVVPGSSYELAKIISACGVPDGVLNYVLGTGPTVGQCLVEHQAVDEVTFTGSVNTGRAIADLCIGGASMKKFQLEMGGKNPFVVLDDADLGVAVDCAINGAFFSTGQRCTTSSRLIVQDGIYDRFLKAFVARMECLRVGHALHDGTDIGPVVNRQQLDKIMHYVKVGQDEGGTLAKGGALIEWETPGFYTQPTLFTDVAPDATLVREEVFGPVATLQQARDYEDALALANDTTFGLSAGIATTSLKHATHFRRNCQAGMVMVNLPTAGVDYHVPFGGQKMSSFGAREQGAYAVDFYTKIKTAYVAA